MRLNLRGMIIEKYPIPEETQRKVVEWMKSSKARGTFAAGDLADYIRELATAERDHKLERVAMRFADRLIQKHKVSDLTRREQGQRPRWGWA